MPILKFALLISALFLASPARATVLHFDDLSGVGDMEFYGGLQWTGWHYAQAVEAPYAAASGLTRLFNNSNDNAFSSDVPFTFQGAQLAGYATVNFALYLRGNLVGTSGSLITSDVPVFLPSNYAGIVDRVTVVADLPQYFVMDDVAINGAGASTVPEPGSLALLAGALGMMGLMRRPRPGVGI